VTDDVYVSVEFTITEAKKLGPDITQFTVVAPRVAAHARAGQFVILRVDDHGERIPLTICDHDPQQGTITLVVQSVGRTTELMSDYIAGDSFADILGPLGKPTEIARYGKVIVVGGGLGTAIALPVARALAAAGNHVHGIVGARDEAHLILVDELSATCEKVTVMTDDGSSGRKGLVTVPLADLLETEGADYVFVAGPIVMMAAAAEVTRPLDVMTVASLNPIMVDGTGMCGGCRVRVGGETRFACVDGPEFDAHLVDFDLLATRNRAYADFERCQMTAITVDHD
jgi:ferredoxin--NADP+ reductase